MERSGRSAPGTLHPLQSQVDSLVGHFIEGATDWRLLASFTVGGVAYRMGKIGAMGWGGNAVKALSVGAGLMAELSAFELAHRGLTSLTVGARFPRPQFVSNGTGGETPPLHPENTNLWRWSGPGGLRQGLLQSLVTFGTLKGAGHLTLGQNLIAQHLFQDTAMVLAHHATAAFKITPPPRGSLAEQLMEAEGANLQMGAGMALAHRFAPGVAALERGLQLSLPITDVGARSPRPQLGGRETGEETSPLQMQNGLQPAFALAAPTKLEMKAEERPLPPILSVASGNESVPIVLGGKEILSDFLHGLVEKDLGTPVPKGTPIHEMWIDALKASQIIHEESKVEPLEALRRDFETVARSTPESDFGNYRDAMENLIFAARHWALYQKYGRETLFVKSVMGLYNPMFQPLWYTGKQYWYGAKTGDSPPLPTDYTPQAEAWMKRLEEQLAVATQEMPRLKTREEFLAHRADENLINRVWTYQLLHFIETVGGRAQVKNAECLVESFNPNALPLDSEVLTKALESLRHDRLGPEAEQVIEWEIPYYEVLFGEENSSFLKAPLSSLIRDIQLNLETTVRLADVRADQNLKLRIVSPSLLQRLLETVHGEKAPLLYYVAGEIPRDEMIRLREAGVSAVGIARDPLILNDVQAWAPPWGFFLHDIFHAHSMAPYPPALRAFASALYRHVTGGGLPYSDLREEHLRRVVDLEPRPQKYLSFTLEHLHDIKWLADLNWRRKFQGLEERIRFVKDYQNSLVFFLPLEGEQTLLKTQFRAELASVERKLERTRKLDRMLKLFSLRARKPTP